MIKSISFFLIRGSISLVLFLLIISELYGQFQYKKNNLQIENKYSRTSEKIEYTKNIRFKNAKDITSYLPQRYSRKGDEDYRIYIQKGLDENSKIIMPNFPILIGEEGLRIGSGKKVLFQENSKLIIQSNNKEEYGLLKIDKSKNIEIYYPNLEGDKFSHLTDRGQWGMGIYIVNSENIYIYNAVITKMWGDGIYIGNKNGIINNNISIHQSYMDNNRRNGVSIIAGKNIIIKNSHISNTSGVSPSSGIDIEPNTNKDILKNIILDNITTFNNGSRGILIALDMLNGPHNQQISIQINNHFDNYSPIGMEIYVDRDYVKQSFNNLTGKIKIINSKYYNNSQASFHSGYSKKNNIELIFNFKNEKGDFTSHGNQFQYEFNEGKKILLN